MKENHLVVSETFYSIQGEGQCAGTPAVFLRLAGCNLLCEGKGWRCDTIEVWQKGKSIPFKDVLGEDLMTQLFRGAHLVITGGEPLLQQNQIYAYLKWIRSYVKYLKVEIETNGTVDPIVGMINLVNYWNVSFKLESSGAGSYDKRINENALRSLKSLYGVNFKIVISCGKDMEELIDIIYHLKLPPEEVTLMPAGETREQLDAIRPMVVEWCKEFGYKYSDRLHIVIWNKKVGV